MDRKLDYKAFYDDIVAWIADVNMAVMRAGPDSSEFWIWIADSSGFICRKYNDNRLVVKQMVMLVEWMEEVFEQRKNKGAN
ncbi:hypothetical protein SAMN04487969_101111 [Paenibacillus algorifonticola]|uniref:Uncharacterized protein n=1 Tax=Paenibacillus algorifonticola TaxID=684063 RepID=A0A1I1XUW7_9BACL|nr:hypothetical protein [Paenibacillus algorifonticola]SFE11145.1 hypothetical protein SAMN04487969_101111 [Paenibacillus algorifonticola]